jgi:hypothetical protein
LIINPDGSSYCTRPGTRIRDFSKGGYFDNRTFQHQYRINNPVQQQMRRLFPEKNGKTAPYNQ